jgi:hypothetical protein
LWPLLIDRYSTGIQCTVGYTGGCKLKSDHTVGYTGACKVKSDHTVGYTDVFRLKLFSYIVQVKAIFKQYFVHVISCTT